MHRICRAALIAFILCGLVAVFVTAFVTVGTALADNGPNCHQVLSVNGPPTTVCDSDSTQPPPATVKGKQVGKIEGERAGQDDPVGTNRPCPEMKGSEYCDAWEAAYAAAQTAKAQQQQRGSGISPTDIFKVLGIAAGLIAIVWIGSALAGLSLAGAAATGIRASTVLVRAAARFLKKP